MVYYCIAPFKPQLKLLYIIFFVRVRKFKKMSKLNLIYIFHKCISNNVIFSILFECYALNRKLCSQNELTLFAKHGSLAFVSASDFTFFMNNLFMF